MNRVICLRVIGNLRGRMNLMERSLIEQNGIFALIFGGSVLMRILTVELFLMERVILNFIVPKWMGNMFLHSFKQEPILLIT